MKTAFVALVAAAVSANALVTSEVTEAFLQFQKTHDKHYSTDAEWVKRLSIFADNMEKVAQQNKDHIAIGGEAVFGITKFSDLTAEEFKSMYLTYIPPNTTTVEYTVPVHNGELAATVDWRTKGAVTPVKDQGQCGSCWAFSATEAIESYAFLHNGKLQTLSPQQINSCDKVDGGCNGGNTESAYEYVHSAGGIETEASYPYTSGGGATGKCKFDVTKAVVKITGYKSVATGEANLQTALNSGPVSICIAADAFQSYNSGILKSCPGQIDHCVQAVGYDATNNYWLVRNSWATSWGEQGYARVMMGKNLCHISDDVTYPTF